MNNLQTRNYDYLIKLLLIGDSVKTLLLQALLQLSVIDFKIRTIELDGKRIKLQIWDTAGQERFRTITTAYYRGAMGILLVYDVTDEKSFNNHGLQISNNMLAEDVNKILIGNKCDWEERRVISHEQGQNLAEEYGMLFLEASAKSNVNVDKAFFVLSREIKKRLIDVEQGNNVLGITNIRLDKKNSISKGNCC
ncbi:unnamed protein product [Pneumocystis jirovecii]|uniref:GTP-binding protein ypt2 n=1 Tax=Pneumocystis jirovecii TaxID=42068 RepID=L0PIS9_PNEJI|nr:unnamed protein product [Pneumocystis jirovecii]